MATFIGKVAKAFPSMAIVDKRIAQQELTLNELRAVRELVDSKRYSQANMPVKE